MRPEAESCGGCRFFVERKPLPEGAPVPHFIDPAIGRCRRFPTAVEVRTDDWCGEFERRTA